MSGCYGSIPFLSGHTRRTPPPANGTNRRHRRRQNVDPNYGYADVLSMTVADYRTAAPNQYGRNGCQPSTTRGNAACNPYFRGSSLNQANLGRQYPTCPSEASPYASNPYDARNGGGFHQQQQADSPPDTGMDWMSEQTGTFVHGPATSLATESNGQFMAQSFKQTHTEEPYQSLSSVLLRSNLDQLATLQSGSNGMDQAYQYTPGRQSGSSMDLESPYVDIAQLQLSHDPLESQIEAEPWSTINSRYRDPQYTFPDQEPRVMSAFLDVASSMSASLWSRGDQSTMFHENPDVSETTFNSDIENIVNSYPPVREIESQSGPMRQGAHKRNHTQGQAPHPNAVAFQCRLEREGTPLEVPEVGPNSQIDNPVVYLSARSSLSVPPPGTPNCAHSSPSSGSSQMSVTSFSEPAVLCCDVANCLTKFKGRFRKGNLARHKRRLHKGVPGDYRCKDTHCPRAFNRSDARLKHYRKYHPEFVAGPAIPRGSSNADTSSDLQTSR